MRTITRETDAPILFAVGLVVVVLLAFVAMSMRDGEPLHCFPTYDQFNTIRCLAPEDVDARIYP